MPDIVDCVIADARWEETRLSALANRAAEVVIEELELQGAFEIALLACDDAEISRLNADFRDKPTPTNVLSWPATELSSDQEGKTPRAPDATQPELGDIAIAFDTCQREAHESGNKFEAHVTHLIVHGILHLLGYDHERDKDATLMEQTEVRILAKLGVPDPY